jgi:osmotically-inducible protein OsmY
MKTDLEIKRNAENQLKWEPDVNETDIAVAVSGGVVTLAGYVPHFLDKDNAEKAVKRVAGVSGVANDIEVRLANLDQRPDPEIARDAVTAIKHQYPSHPEKIQVIVTKGWLTLEGEVEWNYQRATLEGAVRWLKGVKGLTNSVKVKPSVGAFEVKHKIEQAFVRSAEIDAAHVNVEASGSSVVLKGTVRSWAERAAAETAAWSAPGVTNVENRLTMSY